jgi:hypothetical protein
MPQQPERRFQRRPPAPLPPTASLPGQALGLGLASAQLLTIKGQLSKSFVMQHVHPSFPRAVGQARRDSEQENLRSLMSLPFGSELVVRLRRAKGYTAQERRKQPNKGGLPTPRSGAAGRGASGL